MDTLKLIAYFRVHPALGILIVLTVFIFSAALLTVAARPAFGLPIGGQISKVSPCVLDSNFVVGLGNTQCGISCPICGVSSPPFQCVVFQEVNTNIGTFCPLKAFQPMTGSISSGNWFLGFGEIMSLFSLPFGTS